MKMSRVSLALFCVAQFAVVAGLAAEVPVHWLEDTPPLATGVSFGVPWARGSVKKDASFSLVAADGRVLPVQTWPLAYWPDGSLKWSGIATVIPAGTAGSFTVRAGPASAGASSVQVDRRDSTIEVDTGKLRCRVGLSGANLIESMWIDGREVARQGRLVCINQVGPDDAPGATPAREKFVSKVTKVTVEQAGPVRAVLKLDGVHQAAVGAREWLPFTVRLYFYAGQESVRLVHTIVYDGHEQRDFVRGLGVEFAVPMREEVQNRHVRFAGPDNGVWAEPIQPGRGDPEQAAGRAIKKGRFHGAGTGGESYAIWNDFQLAQPNPEGFSIRKRTGAASTWIFSDAGRRAGGLAFVGDVSGGLGVGLRHFWQSYPTGFDVRDAGSATAHLTVWLWSPEGPAMDMRHYDTVAHGLAATYEDVQPGMSTPYGVARTSELMLFPRADLPDRAATAAMAQVNETTPRLMPTSEYLRETATLGVWGLVDRSTPLKAAVEDRLDSVLAYYKQQVEERHWYGFWQYGDFLHTYNRAQHVWYYDLGGYAWDNTELAVPLWLWTSFLRTGRAEVFRLAEAHTRNTSETNVYHLGPMAGLGSRHNVVKWGDGAKEARVSQAAHWRAFYYLTTDERTGDIMRAQLASDLAVIAHDPMRLAQPVLPQDPKVPGRLRIGPDWFALAGNWMTEWERTGDPNWRDRINAGVDSILAMPYWIRSGVLNGLNPDLGGQTIGPLKGGGSMTVGYDPGSGKLTPIPDPIVGKQVAVNYNLATIQGGAQVMFELVPLLGRADWAKAWLQYCRLGGAPAQVLEQDRLTGSEGADGRYVEPAQGGARLSAYAYAQTRNPAFVRPALAALSRYRAAEPKRLEGPEALNPVHEAPDISTNDAAQQGLTMIEVLELCRDALPSELPPAPPNPAWGEGRRRGNPVEKK